MTFYNLYPESGAPARPLTNPEARRRATGGAALGRAMKAAVTPLRASVRGSGLTVRPTWSAAANAGGPGYAVKPRAPASSHGVIDADTLTEEPATVAPVVALVRRRALCGQDA